MADERVVPICYVNGKRYELPEGRAEATLLQWLRGSTPTQPIELVRSLVIHSVMPGTGLRDVLAVLLSFNVCNCWLQKFT